MNSIEIPFALGVEVWYARPHSFNEYAPCEECLGSKVCTMVLGNGEQYEMECRGCWPGGCEVSTGRKTTRRVERYPSKYTPKCVTEITEKETSYTNAGEGATSYQIVRSTELFSTEEECAAFCVIDNAKTRAEEDRRNTYCLQENKKQHSWSVHYWRSQRANYVRQIELIDLRMKQIKDSKMHLKINIGGE